MSKTCTKCGELQDEEAFSRHASGGLLGRHSWCKQCMKASRKSWITPEKEGAYAAKHYLKHRDKMRANMRAYYLAHRQERIDAAVKWNRDNPLERSHIAISYLNRRERRCVDVFTITEWKAKLAYFNNACAYCLKTEGR